MKSTSWIKPFSKGMYLLYAGNTIDAFQPLDFYHYFPMWYDLWLTRIVEAMNKLDLWDKTYVEAKDLLPVPSSMRAILGKIIAAYKGSDRTHKESYQKVANLLARMLQEASPADPFAEHSSPVHREEELRDILETINWQKADIPSARKTGQLITAAGSLVHGLYNDVVTDFSWDAYGPYEVTYRDKSYTLLIRHFVDLRPKELWPEEYLASAKEIKIYGLYEGVEWEIAALGCHTIAKKGNPVEGLRYFAVVANNQSISTGEISTLIVELAEKAEKLYGHIRTFGFEELKIMVMRQASYQFKKIFDAANMDWQPTEEMLDRVKNKPLLKNVIPHGVMIQTPEEYVKVFALDEFAHEVLGE